MAVHVVRAQGKNARAWTRQDACFPRNAYGGVRGTKMIVRNGEMVKTFKPLTHLW